MFTGDSGFVPKVEGVWQEVVRGVNMFKVVNKLKKLKGLLKDLNRRKLSDMEKSNDNAYNKMIDLQSQLQANPQNRELQKREREAYNEYEEMNKARISFLKQKVKQQSIQGGDANTTYFHDCLKKRRDQNHIYRIKNMRGEGKRSLMLFDKAFLQYYEDLLGTVDEYTGSVSSTIIREGAVLSREQKRELCLYW